MLVDFVVVDVRQGKLRSPEHSFGRRDRARQHGDRIVGGQTERVETCPRSKTQLFGDVVAHNQYRGRAVGKL
jgi:hypothetical protein